TRRAAPSGCGPPPCAPTSTWSGSGSRSAGSGGRRRKEGVMHRSPTITLPREWVDAVLRDPSRRDGFFGALADAVRAQDAAWGQLVTRKVSAPAVEEVDPAALAAFEETLRRRLESEFPQARQPTREEVVALYGYLGDDPQKMDDLFVCMAGVAAKRPPDYIYHIPGILKSLRANGIENLQAEAAARRKVAPTAEQRD